jgi:DNA-directed RNA polymerase specialized sigma24 family protein
MDYQALSDEELRHLASQGDLRAIAVLRGRYQKQSDEDLMTLVRDCDDRVAHDILASRHLPRLSRIRWWGKVHLTEHESQDEAQETLIKVWVHRGTWKPAPGAFQRWIDTIARHVAVDILRKRPRGSDSLVVDLAAPPEEKPIPNGEMAEVLLQVYHRDLKATHREVVYARLLEPDRQRPPWEPLLNDRLFDLFHCPQAPSLPLDSALARYIADLAERKLAPLRVVSERTGFGLAKCDRLWLAYESAVRWEVWARR